MDKNDIPRRDGRARRRYDPLSYPPEAFVDEFTDGQMLALMALVDTLIQTHPRADTVRAAYLHSRETLMAQALHSTATDEYIDGMQRVHVLVAPMLGLAADA
jgi:hypothetical protein